MYYGLNVVSSVSLPCPISFAKEEILLYFIHMFSYEFYFPGYRYNLVGYELNWDTNDPSTIFICVPIESAIVAI